MDKILFKLFLAFLAFSFMSSCVVSKKKYEALEHTMLHRTDSLSTIITDNRTDFNTFLNKTNFNESKKLDKLDSLFNEVYKLTSDTTQLKESLRNAISEFEREKNAFTQLIMELEVKSAEVENLRLSLEKKEQELLSLQEMIDKNKEETDKLFNLISKALISFDNTELTVYEKNGKVFVSLEEKLLFRTGSAQIDKKGQDVIIQLAKILENNTDISILIEGHTDNVGSSEMNWNLSTQRALAVVKIIENNSKVDLSRITVAGRGMYSPVAENTSDEGKRRNRRIEIILTPNLEQLYKILEK